MKDNALYENLKRNKVKFSFFIAFLSGTVGLISTIAVQGVPDTRMLMSAWLGYVLVAFVFIGSAVIYAVYKVEKDSRLEMKLTTGVENENKE